jgi:hypothetical protein
MYFVVFHSTEKLSNVDSDIKTRVVNTIKKNFKDSTTIIDYLNLLERAENTSLKLLETETFYALRDLFRQNALTEDAIMKYMTDI